MEILNLEEKAMTYVRKITPARKERFSLVESAECKDNYCNEYSDYVVGGKVKQKSKWKLYLFTFLLCIVMCFSGCKILLTKSDIISVELLSVIEKLFTPKDFGKIKFVDTGAVDNESEAISFVGSFSLPFNACISQKIEETFLLESPSEITIKCAMDGVVENIIYDSVTQKKKVVVKHKFDLISEYLYMDNVCVNKGDSVEKNTILGLSFDNKVGFKITYKNSMIKGFEIINGELSFY